MDPYDDLPTEELTRLAKTGDREAFGAWYERNFGKYFTWVYTRIHFHKRGCVDPRDVLAHAYLKTLELLPKWEIENRALDRSFRATLRYTLLEHLRPQGKANSPTHASPTEIEAATRMTQALAGREFMELLRQVLDNANEEERELIWLLGDGLSYREIAERWQEKGKSPEAIRQQCNRLRRRLMHFPGLEDFFPELDSPEGDGDQLP